MPFTVDDFQDLVRLLDQRPEWRADLRRLVLSQELLDLPGIVRELAEAQNRTDQQLALLTARVETLAEVQNRTEQQLALLTIRVETLAEAQNRTEQQLALLTARVETLAEYQLRAEHRLLALEARLDEHERRNALDLQIIKDGQLVQALAGRAGLFAELVAEPRLLRSDEAGAWLASLRSSGRLTPSEHRELLLADAIVRGEREGQEGYLVVEASWTIGLRDIDRAVRRAALLGERVGVPAWPAVVGYRVSEDASSRLAGQDILHLLLPE